MARVIKIQSVEERLAEVDRVILNTAEHGCALLRSGAPISEVDSATEFLRTLYRRRDVILNELKKAGVTKKRAYEDLGIRKEETRYELDRYMV